MSQPIVSAEDLTYADEYDPMREVYLGPEPFSGTARDVNQWRTETTDYRAGQAHGRHEVRLADGTLTTEATYAAGECTQLRARYPDGTPQETYTAENAETHRWTPAGVLAFRGATDAAGQPHTWWYYPDGTVRQHYLAGHGTDHFAADGRQAMRVRYGPALSTVTYAPDVLRACYADLLMPYPLEASQEQSSVEWYFFGWVWQLLKQDRPAAEAMLRHLHGLGATGAHTAGLILAKLPTLDLATFEPALSYRIEA